MEDFFEGNDDCGSIGCNLLDHPGIASFCDVLRSIRSRSNVQDVLIEIDDIQEEDETTWPFSERIYLITNVTGQEVKEWLNPLQPDEIEEGFALGIPNSAPSIGKDMIVYSAWWD